MSKRTRAPRATRPGTRPPINRPPGARPARARPTEAVATTPPTPLEAAPQLAEEVVEQRPIAAVAVPRRTTHAAHPRPRAKPGSVLAARAANEYVYVAQDIRRIVLVAGALFAVMIVAWLLIAVVKVVPLAFY